MSTRATAVDEILQRWQGSSLWRHVRSHRVFDAQTADDRPLPEWLDPRLRGALERRGITRLYRHQAEACEAVQRGRDVVIATPTASGKTICYNLPVFQRLLTDPRARAIYLFPTKALARDQIEEARALAGATGAEIGVAVYDGDTPTDQRRVARRRARILATNPEMLHAGILPHHPAWAELLGGLRYVVLDELHVYRGVFGSQVAQVLRRLQRLARFHGAEPQFICSSATIANPAELAGALVGRPVECVDRSGAPAGVRHFVVYNPPLIDAALGLRESYLHAACKLTRELVTSAIGTLVFCRSRLAVEVLLRSLRDAVDASRAVDEPRPEVESMIRGYRGGYLPARRRAIEQGLRAGQTRAVVATSALELGIDIGALDAVVIAGWPGSRAATWQRAGRAGRRLAPALAVMVASSEPLDQYIAADPDYLFGQAPEHARLDPDNAAILVPHIKCAAYELPFLPGDTFGSLTTTETDEVLGCMADAALLHRSAQGYHYVGDAYPAAEVSLRGPAEDNFLVVRTGGDPDGQVIAEVDYQDAPQELHDQAIYQLEGRQYQVLRLDHAQHKAYVAAVQVDYYTDALTQTHVRVLERLAQDAAVCQGEVHILHRVVGFKKIKLHTHENIGYGEVSQPDREMHTTALWLTAPAPAVEVLGREPAEVAEAALGAARVLHAAAALLLLGDARDLGRAVGDARSSWFPVAGRIGRAVFGDDLAAIDGPLAPTIFLFDRYPGGIGSSERLYDERAELIARTLRIIDRCACRNGCPGCIGPGATAGAKQVARELLAAVEQSLHRCDALAERSHAAGIRSGAAFAAANEPLDEAR